MPFRVILSLPAALYAGELATSYFSSGEDRRRLLRAEEQDLGGRHCRHLPPLTAGTSTGRPRTG